MHNEAKPTAGQVTAAVSHRPSKPAGYPSREPDLDVYPGFVSPPEGYGEVAFYWWLGDRLDKERLEWQLNQLKDHRVTALQINYAHSDEGGQSFGLTYRSEPPLFSEAWWELFAWFAGKAGELGISVSLSDYTICTPGQGWYADEILAAHPELNGAVLAHAEWPGEAGRTEWALPAGTLSVTAIRGSETEGKLPLVLDVTSFVEQSVLRWQQPEGSWRLVAVYAEAKPLSIDPMHPLSGALVIEHFFQRFEDRLAGVPNARLGFFFSDELDFGLKGHLWSDALRETFKRDKGYDPIPELAGLFTDIGPRTEKIRLDYGDVMVQLSEDHYFRPVFEWHQERGLIYGCDHGGRGKDTTEFGDYFRTQRWNQGPGCDQPNFECDLMKNKVASSIAHLYERPRTWLEGFYGSGWGTNTANLTDAIFRNFVTGHNLLTLHGLYYSTHGGWWEWAPPCNHFRMPYWTQMKSLMACTERLSYLLSQGVHVCDAAIVYPVASVEAGPDGEIAVSTAFEAGERLYAQGIDFDFIDFQSIERAETAQGKLAVAGETYRVLIVPAMRTLRYSTLQQALAFYRAGGIVIALGALPEASDRAGSSDPVLDEAVRELFGRTAAEARAVEGVSVQRGAAGGLAVTAASVEEAIDALGESFPRDFKYDVSCREQAGAAEDADGAYMADGADKNDYPYVQHRRIGKRDIYAVYRAPRGAVCFFRSRGAVSLWNPWDGTSAPLAAERVTAEGAYIRLPLDRRQLQLIVFSEAAEATELFEIAEGAEVADTLNAAGDADVEGTALTRSLAQDGEWSFELRPTMDNRFGDFRLPGEETLIGAEARYFKFAWETDDSAQWHAPGLDDAEWPYTRAGFGPRFWKLGPVPAGSVSEAQERDWAAMAASPEAGAEGRGVARWTPYTYSTRFGLAHDPGHQGYHGLKGKVTDSFIALGSQVLTLTGSRYEAEPEGDVYYMWTTLRSDREQEAHVRIGGEIPTRMWINGRAVDPSQHRTIVVPSGSCPLLLRYDGPGRGYVVFEAVDAPATPGAAAIPLAMSWYDQPGVLSYDAYPERRERAGWYRFTAPPGLAELELTAHGRPEVWVQGERCEVTAIASGAEGAQVYRVVVGGPARGVSAVAIRLQHEQAAYLGAGLPEPVKLRCTEGRMLAGDWSRIDGLACYSGGAVYRRELDWTPEKEPRRVLLQLGDVTASAEVLVNGQPVCTLLAPPWEADIGRLLKHGVNEIEVRVYNTLANHYATIPTRYGGERTSGLLGPVRLEIGY